MLGHRASSHTVWSPRPLRSFLILLKEAPDGMEVLRCAGSRGLREIEGLQMNSLQYAYPRAFPRMIRSGGASPEIKWSSEGPAARASLKLDLEAPVGVAVARERAWKSETRFAARRAEDVDMEGRTKTDRITFQSALTHLKP